MTRPVIFAEDEFYHLYNRGVDKRVIFHSPRDYKRFQTLLYLSNSTRSFVWRDIPDKERYEQDRGETLVDVGAYCLMSNHFHLLVKAKGDKTVSKFMQKVQTAYTMYFNTVNERSGALFQGKFKARHVAQDQYLKYLFAYLHLNPYGHTFTTSFEEYPYSSYYDYLEKDREEKNILHPDSFPEYFLSSNDMKKDMEEWLTYRTFLTEVEPL